MKENELQTCDQSPENDVTPDVSHFMLLTYLSVMASNKATYLSSLSVFLL